MNPEKSAFLPAKLHTQNSAPAAQDHKTGSSGKPAEVAPSSQKKKRPIMESDTDSDLDFCEEVPAKMKKHTSSASKLQEVSSAHEQQGEEWFLLESDDDWSELENEVVEKSKQKTEEMVIT